MKPSRKCKSLNEHGQPCGTPPLVDHAVCMWHSPDHQEAAQKARAAGGRRRQKEQMTEVIFDLGDITSSEGQERLYKITVLDTVQLESSPARTRALVALMKLNNDVSQKAELAQRISELEEATDQEHEFKP